MCPAIEGSERRRKYVIFIGETILQQKNMISVSCESPLGGANLQVFVKYVETETIYFILFLELKSLVF